MDTGGLPLHQLLPQHQSLLTPLLQLALQLSHLAGEGGGLKKGVLRRGGGVLKRGGVEKGGC